MKFTYTATAKSPSIEPKELEAILTSPDEYRKNAINNYTPGTAAQQTEFDDARQALSAKYTEARAEAETNLASLERYLLELNQQLGLNVQPPSDIPITQELNDKSLESMSEENSISAKTQQDKFLKDIYEAYQKTPNGRKMFPETWENHIAKKINKSATELSEQIERITGIINSGSRTQSPFTSEEQIDLRINAVKERQLKIIFEKSDFDENGKLKPELIELLKKYDPLTYTQAFISKQESAFHTLLEINKCCAITNNPEFTEKQNDFITSLGDLTNFNQGLPSERLAAVMKKIDRFPVDTLDSQFSKFLKQIAEYCTTFITTFLQKGVTASEAHETANKKAEEIYTPSEIYRKKLSEAASPPKEEQNNSSPTP